MKKLLVLVFLVIGIPVISYLYLQNLQRETKQLCEILSESKSMDLNVAITLSKKKGFTVSTGSNNGTQALFHKLSTIPGLCIGVHKNGKLFNVKYHGSP